MRRILGPPTPPERHRMADTTPNDRLATDLHKHITATPHAAHDASPDISVTATAIALFDLFADEIANHGYPA